MQHQDFFTKVQIPPAPGWMDYTLPAWTIGSCFADEIGERMRASLLPVRVNPCGTLYNPLSIASTLRGVAEGRGAPLEGLFCHQGLYRCLRFHSSFGAPTPEAALAKMNSCIATLHEELPRLRRLMLTLGSAHLFEYIPTGEVVANCHKLPPRNFRERDAGIDEMTSALASAIELLRRSAPGLEVLLTVSPIRHKAYGYRQDKLSKASLLITAANLEQQLPGVRYFPSYEIMQDELRDYRFYAADMVHPSPTACDYIYDRWEETFLTAPSRRCAADCRRLTRRSAHRFSEDTPREEIVAFHVAAREAGSKFVELHPQAAHVITDYLDKYHII